MLALRRANCDTTRQRFLPPESSARRLSPFPRRARYWCQPLISRCFPGEPGSLTRQKSGPIGVVQKSRGGSAKASVRTPSQWPISSGWSSKGRRGCAAEARDRRNHFRLRAKRSTGESDPQVTEPRTAINDEVPAEALPVDGRFSSRGAKSLPLWCVDRSARRTEALRLSRNPRVKARPFCSGAQVSIFQKEVMMRTLSIAAVLMLTSVSAYAQGAASNAAANLAGRSPRRAYAGRRSRLPSPATPPSSRATKASRCTPGSRARRRLARAPPGTCSASSIAEPSSGLTARGGASSRSASSSDWRPGRALHCGASAAVKRESRDPSLSAFGRTGPDRPCRVFGPASASGTTPKRPVAGSAEVDRSSIDDLDRVISTPLPQGFLSGPRFELVPSVEGSSPDE